MANYTPNVWTSGDTITKAKLDRLEGGVASALPSADAVKTVAGVAKTSSGDIPLTPDDIGAMAGDYKPAVSDLPLALVVPVLKDDGPGGTGFWPKSWTGRAPVYTAGSSTAGARPVSDAPPLVVCEWQCRDGIFPPRVASGTAGMLPGDRQIIVG